jgi:hypothetical protein
MSSPPDLLPQPDMQASFIGNAYEEEKPAGQEIRSSVYSTPQTLKILGDWSGLHNACMTAM